ncbi:MAG: hypothetical protein JSW65_05555, partial [Candidatus Bipolaricaulota bacterium]
PATMDLDGGSLPEGGTRGVPAVNGVRTVVSPALGASSWELQRARAVEISSAVHDLFTDPDVLPPSRLCDTPPWPLRLSDGSELSLTAGWHVWAWTIDHEGFAHIVDLETAGEQLRFD